MGCARREYRSEGTRSSTNILPDHAVAAILRPRNEEITMNPEVAIRNEVDADIDAINEVTLKAFKALEISNHTEQFIIAALRKDKALTISLVAELDGRVIGHIAFSPVTFSDGTRNWYGLGPVSVLPEYQRKGIGKALIREGLSRLKSECPGVLSRWTSGILQEVWIRQRIRACLRRRAARGVFRFVPRWAYSAGNCHVPRGFQSRRLNKAFDHTFTLYRRGAYRGQACINAL